MAKNQHIDLSSIDLEALMADLTALRCEIDASIGEEDLKHLQKIERWGRTCTAIGLATAGFAPNPASAALLSLGHTTRWMMLHHIHHRAYDKIPGVPARYTSKRYARGFRRYTDFMDWILPEGWGAEHVYHHAHTNEPGDLTSPHHRLSELDGFSQELRYVLLGISWVSWRPLDYAPMSLRLWLERHMSKEPDKEERLSTAEFFRKTVLISSLPHIATHFVAMPLCYFPLGPWGVFSALCNSVMADALMTLYLFVIFTPTHTGEDLYRFTDRPRSRAEYMLRQIVSTTDYTTGHGDLRDWLHMWLNYHIEHHLFPDVPLRTYQWVQPKLRAICEAHGIPYVQESALRRFKQLMDIIVGKTKQMAYRSELPAQAVATASA